MVARRGERDDHLLPPASYSGTRNIFSLATIKKSNSIAVVAILGHDQACALELRPGHKFEIEDVALYKGEPFEMGFRSREEGSILSIRSSIPTRQKMYPDLIITKFSMFSFRSLSKFHHFSLVMDEAHA